MPVFDGTGPKGEGPFTGRGLGFCIFKNDSEKSKQTGYAGFQGNPVAIENKKTAVALTSSLQKRNTSRAMVNKKEGNDMPRGDGTGPAGMGPMTGRAAGFCAGYSMPGYANPVAGRGFGFGRGRGFGFGRGLGLGFRGGRGFGGYFGGMPYAAPAYPYGAAVPQYGAPYGPTLEQETDALKGQAEYFEDALEGIKKRIAELEKSGEDKK